MVPTLFGRIQTRIALLAVIGGIWTLIIAPLLPGATSAGAAYRVAFTVLALIIVAGVVWEFVYHFLQQFRWEKDWPTLFGLLTAINEGVVVWLLARYVLPPDLRPSAIAFAILFTTTWLIVWLVANGPIRAVFPHWRFNGGRFA
ncbi:hypothetical protein GCM10027169_32920 [Gordonia jinhuaensis]|uniref:Uncharacterized protein n=1 Tax=Gordonia jinhuaensis TaxID=1517702 RepID=A0A916T3Z0_9ACTN|nr:hypothetical protein [Gordonia jinhuaensis]GGB27155.1 hypothetical protein GCM10011489_14120 [Gordonia jinhuaensis]